jgi:enoyl-CoA hydratase/carnithine racemase
MAGELHVDEPLDGVRRLVLSNPAKRNALDHAMLDALEAEVLAAQAEPEVRCLVLTGADGLFSSGYDIGDIPDDVFAQEAERLVAHPETGAFDALAATDMPTIAVLPGAAIGGGLELALACDLRIARDGIEVGMPPAKLGLVYSHTGLRRFLHIAGEARTRQLFLLGRNIDAGTALAWNLVHEVVAEAELEDTALEWARELAANAPLSMQGTKRVLRELLDAQVRLEPDVEKWLVDLRRASFASKDLREGVRAFGQKRPPRWTGH